MQDADAKQRAATLQKYTRTNLPRHEPEVEDASDSYQDARAYVREALMLDVRLRDGTVESFDYPSLRRVRFQPGDRMVLTFGDVRITVEGRGLGPLRDAITEHRRRYIQEGTRAEEMLSEGEAYIERIALPPDDD